MSPRVGLFGGTFDPIHHAHLSMARAAAEQCCLDRVLLAPAANPPHRLQGPYASYDDRFRMVELACEGNPLLSASRIDAGAGKSYSIAMVERFLAKHEGTEVFFIIGADAFAEVTAWHRWQDVAKLVTFAVIGRPGAAYTIPPETKVQPVSGVHLGISSSEIRRRIAAGDFKVEVPAAVLAYIEQRGLYGATGSG